MSVQRRKSSIDEHDPAFNSEGSIPNPNVEVLSQRGFFIAYIAFLLLGRLTYFVLDAWIPGFYTKHAWTYVNAVHAVLSFYLLHWVKGAPFFIQQPPEDEDIENETFWEQIDHGKQFTYNRKMLSLIPVALYVSIFVNSITFLTCLRFVIATHFNSYEWSFALIVNITSLLLCLIPKSSSMHHVRIAGINR